MDQSISVRKLEEAKEGSCGCNRVDDCKDNLFSYHHKNLKSSRCKSCSWRTCIFTSFLLLVLALCSAAVAMSAVALWSSRNWKGNAILMDSSNNEMDREALHQVEVLLESTGEMSFQYKHQPDPSPSKVPSEEFLVENAPGRDVERRSANKDACISTNETNLKPLAHIVGESDKINRIDTPNDRGFWSVITKNWRCASESRNQGSVQGGMIFDRSTGFLEVPVSGFYYVYYRILFRPKYKKTQMMKSRLVACVPDVNCDFMDDYVIQTEQKMVGNGFGIGLSQSGLLYFTAGTRIAVLNEDYRSAMYDNFGGHTYMGAFLVDRD